MFLFCLFILVPIRIGVCRCNVLCVCTFTARVQHGKFTVYAILGQYDWYYYKGYSSFWHRICRFSKINTINKQSKKSIAMPRKLENNSNIKISFMDVHNHDGFVNSSQRTSLSLYIRLFLSIKLY